MAMADAGETLPTVGATAPLVGTLDPQLFMAARRGDNTRLRELLRLDDNNQGQSSGTASPPPHQAFVVNVDPAPAAAPSFSGAVTSNEGDSLLHVVAAHGDDDDVNRYLDCATTIYLSNNGLLVARNDKGDTPLHCAASAGSAAMISCLIALKIAEASDMAAVKEFLWMRNNCGETALHQAVRAASTACIDRLLLVDPCLVTSVPREGEEGASPFYLAFSLGEMDIARHLFDGNNGQLSYSGPDGQNVLHAAVSRGQALSTLLEWLNDLTVPQDGSVVPLVSHLAQQRDKQTGSTPLHLAASLEGWPYLEILSKWFPDVWPRPKPAVELLLDANACAAYQPDAQGLYPIHVAALADSLDAVRAMLDKCPDGATLRDARGRTFLHAAVEAEAYKVVEYACRRMPKSVLNLQDDNGDTAIHRAVDVGNLPVFNCLFRNQQVHLNVPNKDALTPYDLSWVRVPSLFYYDMNPRGLIQLSLQFVGAPCGGSRPDLLSQKHKPKIDKDMLSAHLTNAAQMLAVVSVLVAAVTFASAFTLPGGYYQAGGGPADGVAGTPVLAGSYAFDVFILSDTLAFVCSCMAAFSLIFVAVPAIDISLRYYYFEFSAVLLRSAGRSLVVAFALGLYLVLTPVAHAMASWVCAINLACSLFATSEAYQILCVAYAASARSGARQMHVARTLGLTFYNVLTIVLLNFWSVVISFGLPVGIAVVARVLAKH